MRRLPYHSPSHVNLTLDELLQVTIQLTIPPDSYFLCFAYECSARGRCLGASSAPAIASTSITTSHSTSLTSHLHRHPSVAGTCKKVTNCSAQT